MSGFGGRRGQNVSSYIAGLNVAPSAFDGQQNVDDFDLNFGEDGFLNTDFLDFNHTQPNVSQSVDMSRRASTVGYSPNANSPDDVLNGGFTLPSNFDYPNSASSITNGHHEQFPLPPLSSPTARSPMSASAGPPSGTKRKIEALNEPRAPVSLEEATRMAAEEDKRRRNTAASARFRVKKKQREQALEKTAKEMTDRVHALEKKVEDLANENKLLKSLLVEKNGNRNSDKTSSRRKEDTSDNSRSKEDRKDGVGTEVESGDESG